MPQKVAVRRINEWDGPAMLKIYAPYAEQTLACEEQESPPLAEYIQRIDRYTYGLGWLLCEIDSVPAGFCHLTEDRTDPENLFFVELCLYVKPEFQRRGVGRALYALIEDIMEYGNRRKVSVRILQPNPEAVAFFEAMGFSPEMVLKQAVEKLQQKRDVLVLSKQLSPVNPEALRPTKPYLIENADYEAAREAAAGLVRGKENASH